MYNSTSGISLSRQLQALEPATLIPLEIMKPGEAAAAEIADALRTIACHYCMNSLPCDVSSPYQLFCSGMCLPLCCTCNGVHSQRVQAVHERYTLAAPWWQPLLPTAPVRAVTSNNTSPECGPVH